MLKHHHFYVSLLCQNSPWILTGLTPAAPCRHLWVLHGSDNSKQHQCAISQNEGTKAAQTNTANQRQQIWYVYLEHPAAKDQLIISQKSVIEARENHLAQCRGRRKRKEQEFRMQAQHRVSLKGHKMHNNFSSIINWYKRSRSRWL